jgi:hypothetical protein
MNAVRPYYTNQPIRRFTTLCDRAFKARLAKFGFIRVSKMSKSHLCSHIYRNANLYITVFANTHFRDAPNYCGVNLGEGSDKWPESDWNSIALWQMVKRQNPEEFNDEAPPYGLRYSEELPKELEHMSEHLLTYASDFLKSDLTVFHEIRSAITQGREPYKVYQLNEEGRYEISIDEESMRLKERFSK